MKSKLKKPVTLPKTKLSKKTGLYKITANGYLKNKNGKILPLKVLKNKE